MNCNILTKNLPDGSVLVRVMRPDGTCLAHSTGSSFDACQRPILRAIGRETEREKLYGAGWHLDQTKVDLVKAKDRAARAARAAGPTIKGT